MDKRYIEQLYLRKYRPHALNTRSGRMSKLGRMLRILEEPCCRSEHLIPHTPQKAKPNELCMSCGLYRFTVKPRK